MFSWQLDLKDMPVTRNEYKHYALAVDVHSGYMMGEPLRSKTQDELLPKVEQKFRDYGAPRILQTDNGPEFGPRLSAVCQLYNVLHVRGSPHHPQSQGIIARAYLPSAC